MSRWGLRTAAVMGVLAFVCVVAAGIFVSRSNPQQWQAEARIAVFPQEDDAAARASFYETLSSGQIVATIADLVRVDLASADDEELDVRVMVNTSIIVVAARTDTAAAAEAAADAGAQRALTRIETLQIPFTGVLVGRAAPAERTGVSPLTTTGAILFAGAAIALGVVQAVLAIGRSARRRVTRGDVPGDDMPIADGPVADGPSADVAAMRPVAAAPPSASSAAH